MSNETEKMESKANLIGVDPLAWLSEEEQASVSSDNKEVGTETKAIGTVENTGEDYAEENGSSYFIKLNDVVTIRNVSELMEQLNSIDPDKTDLVFESDQVEKVDAAALQLLTGFYLFAIEEGKKVVWHKPSDALCRAVDLLGLKDIINISSAA